jgi:hypothetical protein
MSTSNSVSCVAAVNIDDRIASFVSVSSSSAISRYPRLVVESVSRRESADAAGIAVGVIRSLPRGEEVVTIVFP